MDSFKLGRLIGEIEARLEALETEWETIKHYGRRGILLGALVLAALLAHMEPEEIAVLLKNAAQILASLAG